MLFAAYHLAGQQRYSMLAASAELSMFSWGSTDESMSSCFRSFLFAREIVDRKNKRGCLCAR